MTPPPPDPEVPGLGPIHIEPLSVHPPYMMAPGYRQDTGERYLALLAAIGDGTPLGRYEVNTLGWLAEQGTGPVAVVGSLLRRVRAHALHTGRTTP
ncbi:MAG: hypothetical protein ACRDRW_20330 [Pseudonocardiaceae bacterium]